MRFEVLDMPSKKPVAFQTCLAECGDLDCPQVCTVAHHAVANIDRYATEPEVDTPYVEALNKMTDAEKADERFPKNAVVLPIKLADFDAPFTLYPEAIDRFLIRLRLADPEDDSFGCAMAAASRGGISACSNATLFNETFPLYVRATAVAIAEGEEFSGWNKYYGKDNMRQKQSAEAGDKATEFLLFDEKAEIIEDGMNLDQGAFFIDTKAFPTPQFWPKDWKAYRDGQILLKVELMAEPENKIPMAFEMCIEQEGKKACAPYGETIINLCCRCCVRRATHWVRARSPS